METYFRGIRDVFHRLAEDPPPQLDTFVERLLSTWERGGKLLSFGNGGSAADTLHFTTELVHRFRDKPIQKPALSLASSSSSLTAIPNDWSFEEVYSCQVRSLGTPSDVALGISTSGNSANVLEGLRAAAEVGMDCFGLTGSAGGQMASLDLTLIRVPTDVTAHVQEAHIACLHYVCLAIDRRLNG